MDEEATETIEDIEKPTADTQVEEIKRLRLYMQITATGIAIIVLTIFSLLLYFIRSALLIIVIAFVGSYILSPVVRFFERRRINRLLALTALYVMLIGLVVVCAILLLPILWDELGEMQEGIQNSLSNPELASNISARLESVKARLAGSLPFIKNVNISEQFSVEQGISRAVSFVTDYMGQALKTVSSFSGKIIWLIAIAILIPFITFFLIKDGSTMKRSIVRLVPGKHRDASIELLEKIDRQIGKYIRGRLAEAIILSIVTIVGLRILHIRYYLLIGAVAGFANLVPYIGPVAVAIPPSILALYQYGPLHMVITGTFMGVVQLIDNTFVIPLVVGRSIDLHPVLTIFVVLIGGQLLGIMGMMLAMPVTAIIILIFQTVHRELRYDSQSAQE